MYITGKPAGAQTSGNSEYELVVNSDGSINTTASGGGGGAVTIADGAAVNIGALADASSASTLTGLLKNLKAALAGTLLTSNTPAAAATATLANVAGSASSVTLIALNTSRLGASIVNDSTAILYIKYGSTASATSYNYILSGSVSGVGPVWEMPAYPRYTGIITGIWASAVGSARVNELTP